MIHHSILGSLEPLVAHLTEVHRAYPAWLAPVHLVVLPVTDGQIPPAVALVQHRRGQNPFTTILPIVAPLSIMV